MSAQQSTDPGSILPDKTITQLRSSSSVLYVVNAKRVGTSHDEYHMAPLTEATEVRMRATQAAEINRIQSDLADLVAAAYNTSEVPMLNPLLPTQDTLQVTFSVPLDATDSGEAARKSYTARQEIFDNLQLNGLFSQVTRVNI